MRVGRLTAVRVAAVLLYVSASATLVGTARAQGGADTAGAHPLSLDEAVRVAEQQSKTLRIARNAVTRASGQQYQARSALLPQLNATANYTRTLKSQFQGVFGGGSSSATPTTPAPAGPCDQYILDASAPSTDRVTGLEQYARCASAGSGLGIDFSQVGFGAANAYTLGLAGSQNLFTGGRVSGQIAAANAGREAAGIEVTAQRAQLTLDVTQAYYDAALADRLAAIAESTFVQAEAQFRQVELQQKVGNTSEFELLRATVARDNQRPVVIQRRGERAVAYLRLKQLLNVPLERPLRLTTPIEDTTVVPPGVSRARAAAPDTATGRRAVVRQASANIEAQRGLLRVARSQRLPSLALSTQYNRLAYPNGGIPAWSVFRPNWTVSVVTSLPLFAGGRIRGDELVAESNLRDARDRLQQTREFAALDTRVALTAMQEAEAALAASVGTATVAQRAYQIAEVRFREGLSTQLELNDVRTQLQQALVNRALAARNLLVARVRLALLPDLPLQTQAAGQGGASQQQQQQQQQQQMQQQATQASQQPGASQSGSGASGL